MLKFGKLSRANTLGLGNSFEFFDIPNKTGRVLSKFQRMYVCVTNYVYYKHCRVLCKEHILRLHTLIRSGRLCSTTPEIKASHLMLSHVDGKAHSYRGSYLFRLLFF